jgi:hypothetical protein
VDAAFYTRTQRERVTAETAAESEEIAAKRRKKLKTDCFRERCDEMMLCSLSIFLRLLRFFAAILLVAGVARSLTIWILL